MTSESFEPNEPPSSVDERLQGLFESAAASVVQSDINNTVVNVNQAFCDMIGYSKSEIIGRPHSDFVHPDYKTPPQEFKSLISGEISRYERRKLYIRKDGTPVWAIVSVSLQKHQSGERKYTINIVRDITEQKRAEDELQAELEDKRKLQEISTRLISSDDIDLLFGELVTAAVDITRADYGTLQLFDSNSQTLQLLAHRGLNQQMVEEFQVVTSEFLTSCSEAMKRKERVIVSDYSTDKPFAGSASATAHLSANIWAAQSTPLISRSGNLVGMISTHWSKPHRPQERQLRLLDILARQAADLIDRSNSEAALRESEERYRAIVEGQLEMVCRFRPDGTILFVNGAYARSRGTTPEALTGANFWEFVSAEDRPSVRAMLETLLPESPDIRIENRFETAEGVRWTLWNNHAITFDAEGRATAVQSTGIDITERKRAEELVRFQAGLLDTVEQAVIVTDAQGNITYWNRFAEQLYGWRQEEVIGRNVVEVTPAPEMEQFASEIMDQLVHGKSWAGEFQFRRRDGSTFWAHVTDTPIRDEDGTLVGVIGTSVDITERKRIEQAVQESYEQHRLALASADLGTWDFDFNKGTLYWDERCREVFGVKSGDAIAYDSALRLIRPDYKELTNQKVQAALDPSSDGHYLCEYPVVHPDCSERWVMAVGQAYFEGEGEERRATRFIGTVQDITERKLAETSLRESEERYRGTFDNAAAGAAHISLEGRYLRVNKKLCEIVGYSKDELLNMAFQQITHPQDLLTDEEGIRRLLSGEIREYTIEKRAICKGGEPAWLSVTRSLAYKPDGSPDYLIAVIIDISLQKELEETLRQANETLEQRVHERTAQLEELTASLRLLAAKLSQAEQSERRRLAELIHDDLQQLLVAARMQVRALQAAGDQQALARSSELAVSLLDQAIEEARSLTAQLRPPALYESGLAASLGWLVGWVEQAHAFHVDLDLDDSADNLPEQDAVLLFDSVREMLLNAVKYSGTNRASVSMSEAGDEWFLLSVSDKGSGFDVSVLESPRTDNGGFGLFGIRERVAAAGGRFEVKSAPGKGATFHLFWPKSSSRTAASYRADQLEREARFIRGTGGTAATPEQISVLLVDDHALVRQSIADVLGRQLDVSVVAQASDGQEAVEAVEMYQPQIVVMDVNLPKLNGVQATRIINQRHPGICVIGVSIHNDAATRQAMLDAGASAYLSKDGAIETLLETIRRQPRITSTPRQ